MTTVVLVQQGGTGSNNAADARSALGAAGKAGDTFTGNVNVSATLITQNVEPVSNITYNLGTSTKRFKDLWLSNSTIYLGNTTISANGDKIVVPGMEMTSGMDIGAQIENAYNQANTARDGANGAYAQANGAYAQANGAYGQANNAYAHANIVYAQANAAYSQANNAYNNSNTKLGTSGGSISGDLTISGNLVVQGNATTINVSNLSVNDSIILLSANSSGDAEDIGFVGHITRGATNTHVGLIRKATENRFYLFDNYEVEPTNNVIDIANNNFRVANIRLNTINANSFVTVAGLDVTGQANAAYDAANNRVLKAGDTMTGQLNISSGGLLVTGNVGIGNTSPSDPFVIQDKSLTPNATIHLISSNGSIYSTNFWYTNYGADGGYIYRRASGTLASPTATSSGRITFIIGASTDDGTTFRNTSAINLGLTATANATSHPSYIAFDTTAVGATGRAERVRIDPSGNVGIGTSSPGQKLDVNGAIQLQSSNPVYFFNTNYFVRASTGLELQSGDFIRLLTNGANERVRVDANGNVGIGTSSPGVRLDASGSIRASSQLISTVATGTAPLAVSSTTLVTNLNADLLDGIDSDGFARDYNATGYANTFSENGFVTYYNIAGAPDGSSYGIAINAMLDNDGAYGTQLWVPGQGSFAANLYIRRKDNNSYGSWNKVWHEGNDGAGSGLDADLLDGISSASFLRSDASATNSVDLRAPNFYISADTSNRFGQGVLILRGTSPTVYFQDTDHNSAMLHNNSSLLYVLRGGNDTTSWTQVSGQWPFIFNLTNNDATCGGSFAAVGNVTAYSSDRRLKQNFRKIESAVDKVKSLNGYYFDWIDKVTELGFTPDRKENDIGLIAQEVEAVMPQAVAPAPFDKDPQTDGTYKSKSGENYITINYDKLVPLLVEAIKEQNEKIEKLEAFINERLK